MGKGLVVVVVGLLVCLSLFEMGMVSEGCGLVFIIMLLQAVYALLL